MSRSRPTPLAYDGHSLLVDAPFNVGPDDPVTDEEMEAFVADVDARMAEQ